eukprot:360339-Chlamydomonas_euryale.AAC.4
MQNRAIHPCRSEREWRHTRPRMARVLLLYPFTPNGVVHRASNEAHVYAAHAGQTRARITRHTSALAASKFCSSFDRGDPGSFDPMACGSCTRGRAVCRWSACMCSKRNHDVLSTSSHT